MHKCACQNVLDGTRCAERGIVGGLQSSDWLCNIPQRAAQWERTQSCNRPSEHIIKTFRKLIRATRCQQSSFQKHYKPDQYCTRHTSACFAPLNHTQLASLGTPQNVNASFAFPAKYGVCVCNFILNWKQLGRQPELRGDLHCFYPVC